RAEALPARQIDEIQASTPACRECLSHRDNSGKLSRHFFRVCRGARSHGLRWLAVSARGPKAHEGTADERAGVPRSGNDNERAAGRGGIVDPLIFRLLIDECLEPAVDVRLYLSQALRKERIEIAPQCGVFFFVRQIPQIVTLEILPNHYTRLR